MTVLRRPAGLDVAQLDLPLQRPGEEVTADQFGVVVATNRLRQAPTRDDLIEHACHAAAGEAGIDLQNETLPRERINYAQHVRAAATTS